jgi:aldose 1-epimerase
MKIAKTHFGKTKEGAEVELFTLLNDNQVTVKITNYGAIITSIETPDKNGEIANIACGFDKFETYLSPEYLGSYPYFGCICGRVCNRIANGRLNGYDKRLWTSEMIEENGKVGVKLSYLSPDMEEGYPGNLKVSCTYTLNNLNELTIEYSAETDQTTIVNLTNHTYFNLTGGKEQILNHELQLPAKSFTLNVGSIPTGEILPVEGTVNDFLTSKKLGKDIEGLEDGYDLNFVLDNNDGSMVYAGRLCEEMSGRKVEVYTTQPGIQLYTGYWIPELKIDGQKKFGRYSGVALETQHYPDAINKPHFQTVTLAPGQNFFEKTIYKFGTK